VRGVLVVLVQRGVLHQQLVRQRQHLCSEQAAAFGMRVRGLVRT
jgi:hypothetical protein